MSLKLQKLREEKEEAVTSAFRVGPHSGTGTASGTTSRDLSNDKLPNHRCHLI